MKTEITFPELGLVAMTRAFLGAGVALVIADRMDTHQRKAVGWTLTAVGALTTIPLVIEILGHHLEKRRRDAALQDPLEEDLDAAPLESGPLDVESVAAAELQDEL